MSPRERTLHKVTATEIVIDLMAWTLDDAKINRFQPRVKPPVPIWGSWARRLYVTVCRPEQLPLANSFMGLKFVPVTDEWIQKKAAPRMVFTAADTI